MLVSLIRETYYLTKFKLAINKANIGLATTYLAKHKVASDEVEIHLKTTMADAKAEIGKQKTMIDTLIDSI